MAIRLLDAGTVPHLRSQAVYHGVAHAMGESTPDTVIFATPGNPYACIGFHQRLEEELDLDFCRREGIPVVRREVGGGAVYLDSSQLFVQWIMKPESLPARIEQRFELFARPLVATLRLLGIKACFRPVNDIHVSGRKICGTGAGRIGNAEVLVGNFIFEFDRDVMARLLAAPSDAFREKVRRGLEIYMTTIGDELGREPEVTDVKRTYVKECARVLGCELAQGELSAEELASIEEVEARFASREFLHMPGGLRRAGVKIHEDVRVGESSHQVADRELRITARVRSGFLEDVTVSLRPSNGAADQLVGLDAVLQGVALEESSVTEAVATWRRQTCASQTGPETTDLVETIMGLVESREPQSHA